MIVTSDFTLSDIPEETLIRIYVHHYKLWLREHEENPDEKQPDNQASDAQSQDDGQR